MAALFRDNAADMGDEWPSGVVGFSIFVSVILKSISMFTLCHQLQKLETEFGIFVDSYHAGMCANASFYVGKYTLHICQSLVSSLLIEMKHSFQYNHTILLQQIL